MEIMVTPHQDRPGASVFLIPYGSLYGTHPDLTLASLALSPSNTYGTKEVRGDSPLGTKYTETLTRIASEAACSPST